MDIIFNYDFSLLFSFSSLAAIVVGTIIGTMVGALPGLGPSVGCALLIPFTYNMEPIPAVLLLVSLYMSSQYGGSISSIVLGIPGNPSSVPALLDGHTLAKQGFPGKALGYVLYASTTGGFIGALILMVFTIPLMYITIRFSDPELFLVAVLGLLSIVTLGSEDISKSLVSVTLGLFLTFIGLDVLSGAQRYTFGTVILMDGIAIVPLLTGLFAISEVLNMVSGDLSHKTVDKWENIKVTLPWKEFKSLFKLIFKSSIMGTLFGVIPATGAAAASWFAYSHAKRTSKNPDLFGQGSPEGIAAPESANNASVGGSLVPFLTLGIPGSPTIAVIASALMIHGIQPGPHLLSQNPDLVYSIFWGVLLSVVFMFLVGKYTTTMFASLMAIPSYILVTIVFTISIIGAYAARNSIVDVWIALVAGILGYFMKKLKFSIPAFVLAFVLGRMIERNFRRSLMISQGSYMIFVTRPFALLFLIIIVLMIVSTFWGRKKKAA